MALTYQDNYKQAIELFKLVVKDNPKDLDALFNMGLSYLNTSNGADTAIICFNQGLNALNQDEKEGYLGTEFGLSLGKAYQVSLQPLKAVSIYEEVLKNTPTEDTALIQQIEREIQVCHHADFLIKNPINLTVKNMGSRVNSMYDDHSPLIAVSENQLFFTSRRNWIKLSLLSDGQYAEKIYTVPLLANNYESARLLKVFFKQNEHEAAASLSPDGNQLVLFRNDEHGKSLYLSDYSNNSWSSPVKLPFPINSYSEETHGCISADKSTFFFTSDREGGFGGLDIYMVKKLPDGKWGHPRNLGSNINTEFDEETPMIHYDGKTLYFSSEGHNTMGRLDVFYSQMAPDSSWAFPVNMGYPINTPGDDFFFVPTINKSHAYYASAKFDDTYGGSDIYKVEFDAESNTELAVIEGEIDPNFGSDFSKMRILVTRTNDNSLVGDYRPNPKDGKYMMFLENGYEYQVRQLHIENKEKISYVNVTSNMNYLETKMPVTFKDVAMDVPLINTPKITSISTRNKWPIVENETKQKIETKHKIFVNLPQKTNLADLHKEATEHIVKKSDTLLRSIKYFSPNDFVSISFLPEECGILEKISNQSDKKNIELNLRAMGVDTINHPNIYADKKNYYSKKQLKLYKNSRRVEIEIVEFPEMYKLSISGYTDAGNTRLMNLPVELRHQIAKIGNKEQSLNPALSALRVKYAFEEIIKLINYGVENTEINIIPLGVSYELKMFEK